MRCALLFLSFSTILSAQNGPDVSPKIVQATIHNTTDRALIADIVRHDTPAGYFGIFIAPQSTKTVISPELYWFDTVAMGGYRAQQNASEVYLATILKHGLADYLYIHAPKTKSGSAATLKIEMNINKRITIYQDKDDDHIYMNVSDVYINDEKNL